MIGFYGGSLFSMKDLREFIDDLLTDPKLSEANREKVKKLQADINDWEKRKREEQQAAWEQQQYQIRQAREAIAQELDDAGEFRVRDIMEEMGTDIFRRIDQDGAEQVYHLLEEEYRKAEKRIPTRFKEYEHRSNTDYYAVKNNFYFLFGLAEEIKKTFYGQKDILRVAVSSIPITESATACVLADRFKLSVCS